MSDKIEVQLSEETSQIVYENYLEVQDKFDSFEDYIELLSKYINLKMKETILKEESKRLSDEIKALESSSYTWRWLKMIDEIKSVSWELKQGEFESICALYNKTLDAKGLSPENYNIDDFMSDVFTLFLNKLHQGELELIVKDSLQVNEQSWWTLNKEVKFTKNVNTLSLFNENFK